MISAAPYPAEPASTSCHGPTSCSNPATYNSAANNFRRRSTNGARYCSTNGFSGRATNGVRHCPANSAYDSAAASGLCKP